MEVEQKKLEKSQLEITFELTAEEFAVHFEHALSHMKSHVKVDGFRPGQAPNKMVEEKLKPETLLMETGDHAVKHVYYDYIEENNLEPIGNPEVSIIKIAKGSPFIFKVKITVLPDIELPDYKKIAKTVKGEEISVTGEEVQDSLNYLQKTRAKFTLKNDVAALKDFVEIEYSCKELNEGKPTKDQFVLGEGVFMQGFEDNIAGMKAGEEKEFKVTFPDNSPRKDLAGKEVVFHIKMVSVQKMELPEINDEFAKQLGSFDSSPFAKGERVDTLVALKQSIKQGIEMEKTEQEKQRKRGEVLEKIVEKTKIELPDAMIEYEKKNLMEDLKKKVTQTFSAQGGLASGWEDYLATIKKTEAEIKETYQKEAEKRLKGFLVLKELGKRENIEVMDNEVEEEVSKSIKNYSKEDLAKFDIEQLKEYTKNIIHNEKIFKFLECQ